MVGVKEREREGAKDETNLGKLLLSGVNTLQSSGGVGCSAGPALRLALRNRSVTAARWRHLQNKDTSRLELNKKKCVKCRIMFILV